MAFALSRAICGRQTFISATEFRIANLPLLEPAVIERSARESVSIYPVVVQRLVIINSAT